MHMASGAARVVAVEQRHDQRLAREPFVHRGGLDTEEHARRHAVRVFEAHEAAKAPVGLAEQFDLRVIPLLRDAPHITELLQPWAVLLVAEVVRQHLGGDPVHDFLIAQRVGLGTQVLSLARKRRAHGRLRGQAIEVDHEHRRAGKVGPHFVVRLLDLVARKVRESNLQFAAFGQGLQKLDVLRRWEFALPALEEFERHADDVRVLGWELACLWVEEILAPAQRAARYLLAQQLRTECTNTDDVGHGVGVPAFREHAHTDHAADVLAKFPSSPNGVHHFAQDVGVGQCVY